MTMTKRKLKRIAARQRAYGEAFGKKARTPRLEFPRNGNEREYVFVEHGLTGSLTALLFTKAILEQMQS